MRNCGDLNSILCNVYLSGLVNPFLCASLANHNRNEKKSSFYYKKIFSYLHIAVCISNYFIESKRLHNSSPCFVHLCLKIIIIYSSDVNYRIFMLEIWKDVWDIRENKTNIVAKRHGTTHHVIVICHLISK